MPHTPPAVLVVTADDLARRDAALVERAAHRVLALIDERGALAANPDALLTAAQARQRLRVSTTTLWQMRRRGEIRAILMGRAVRFRAADVEAIARGEVRIAPTRKDADVEVLKRCGAALTEPS